MIPELNEVEVRVLGCLIEKEMSTPLSYPLTLNSLTTACNQKSSREPITDYDENTVQRALETLRQKQLVELVFPGSSRVAKYKHNFAYRLGLNSKLQALMGVLFLRGPQTAGELRTRTERMVTFEDLNAVTERLQDLISRDEGALVALLPPGPGQKERRYAHLLAGEPKLPDYSATLSSSSASEIDSARLLQLEDALAALRHELDTLRADFEAFRRLSHPPEETEGPFQGIA